MGIQLKGLMASHVVTFFLFRNYYLWLIKMVNYLSSDNTSEIKEPSQQNIIFSKQNKKDNYNGKTIKGPHGKSCCCIFSFTKLLSLVDKNGKLLNIWQLFWEKRAFTTECYFLKIKQNSTTLMGKQLKGLMASHVVAFFSFPKLLCLVDKNG